MTDAIPHGSTNVMLGVLIAMVGILLVVITWRRNKPNTPMSAALLGGTGPSHPAMTSSDRYNLVAFLATLVAIVILYGLASLLAWTGKAVESLGLSGVGTGLIGVLGTFRPRTGGISDEQTKTLIDKVPPATGDAANVPPPPTPATEPIAAPGAPGAPAHRAPVVDLSREE